MCSIAAFGAIIEWTHCETTAPSIIISNGEVEVDIPDAPWRVHGEADLPGRSIRLALPQGARASDLTFTVESEPIASAVVVRNAILTEFDNPWSKAGAVASIIPPVAELNGFGYLHGVPIADIYIRPLTYDPASGALSWNRSISISIEYEFTGQKIEFKTLAPVSHGIRERILLSSVVNPEAIPPRPRPCDFSTISSPIRSFPPTRGDDPADGVVIATDEFAPHLESLRSEIDFGLIIEIIPLSEILSTYPPTTDGAERIREFVQDAYEIWGISGVFLVGDVGEIPMRYRHGTAPNSPEYMEIPTDLYFSITEGTWNSNGDAYFGDSDEDDFIPELFTGRFQPQDTLELLAYLEKIRYHRWEIEPDYTNRWMFMGASIQGTDYSGPYLCDSILARGPLPDGIDVLRMYAYSDSTGGDIELTETNFTNEMLVGRYLIFHIDHGFRYVIHTGRNTDHGSGIDIPEFMAMTNSPYCPFFYTYSCEVNSFDVTCVGSASLRPLNGGFVAILAHSRSAYSNHKNLTLNFWNDTVFPSGRTFKLGEALQGTQIAYGEGALGRYYKSILNLMGYPFLDMFLGEPTLVDAYIVPSTPTSTDTLIRVIVTETSSGNPFEGALVVAHSTAGRFAMAETDEYGTARLKYSFEGEEQLIISVSGGGAYPVSDTIPISVSAEEHVVLDKAIFYPCAGDADLDPEPGDVFACALVLHNIGGIAADTVTIDATVPGLLDTTAFYFDLLPGEYCTLSTAFGFVVDSALRGDLNLRPVVSIISENRTSIDTLSITLKGPIFFHSYTEFLDDNDGMPSPGEYGTLVIGIENTGLGDFRGVVADVELTGATPIISHFEPGDISGGDSLILHIPMTVESYDISARVSLSFSNTTPESVIIQNAVPEPPETLWMTAGTDEIRLSWEPPDDSTVVYYHVYRGDSAGGEFQRITPIAVNTAALLDEGLAERCKYRYFVTSVDEWMNEGPSSDTLLAWTTLSYLAPWPISVGPSIQIYSALTITDSENDGEKELFAVGKNYAAIWGFRWHGEPILSGESTDPFFVTSWQDSLPSGLGMWSSPAAGEVFPGESHILINDRSDPSKLHLVNSLTAEEPAGWPVSTSISSMGTPVMADLDGDGQLELLNPTHTGLEVWRADGSEYLPGSGGIFAQFEEGMTGTLWGSPSVGDIDGNGEPDIVMGFGKDTLNNGTLYVFDNNGNVLPGWPLRIANFDFTNVNATLANFDSDTNDLEILAVAYRGGTYIIDDNGEIFDGWPLPAFNQLFYECHTAAADFDGDGICEAVVGGVDKIGVFHPDGTALPGWPISTDGTTETIGNPVIADIDGDGMWDIICAMCKKIYAYDIYGQSLPGFPLVMGDLCSGSPNVCDLDGDGNMEIAAGCFDSRIYVWETGVPYYDTAIAWPTEKGNYHRTGAYGDHWRIVNVPETSAKPDNFSISAYPNPFNSTVTISLSVIPGLIRNPGIEIYDINGRMVAEISALNSPLTRGVATKATGCVFTWQPAASFGSGVYLVRARFDKLSDRGGESVSKRVVYLK